MRKSKVILALSLALIILCAAVPARAAVFCSDVRVRISIGSQREFSFTPVGKFALEGEPDLTLGTDELTVKAVGGRVSLEAGGKTVTAASITLLSGDYGGKTDYIRLKHPTYGTCTYLGNMTFDVYEGSIRAVNTLPVEQYLYGVVPHEMSNLFPIDALKAQAVCARGYAAAKASQNLARAYDLLDTSEDQVYRGYASKNTRAIAAVDATAGQVLTYEGDIIESFYSASNGGQTEKTGNVWSTDYPYYINADDPYDLLNASSIEERTFIPATFNDETLKLMDANILLALENAAYAAAGKEVKLLETVEIIPKTPAYDAPSRCYIEADVTLVVGYTEDGEEKTGQLTITLTLDSLRFGSFQNQIGSLTAKKTRLRMRGAEPGAYRSNGVSYEGFFFTERRYGHGVGLSQRGAQERARAGQPYADILSFYYANTELIAIGDYDTAPKVKSSAYKVRSWGISEIDPGTSGEAFLKKLSSEGELSLVSAKGKPVDDDVCTGQFVRVTYGDGKVFFDLPVVVFGDLDGDGKIGESDVTALQNHLAHGTLLTGARLHAADVDRDGGVDASDLLLLIRFINGDDKIV
ncbi:MAG TPA: SpoIID/LytB domain-containing protein [Clostridia bacterium]|nr:SpoIID/LytB domain-containing protein [Clostridia bacterium]